MAGQVARYGTTSRTYIEEVADALDGKVGYLVMHGTTAGEDSIKLATGNDVAIGVVVGTLKEGTGTKKAVSVDLIDSGGVARVRAGGVIAKGAGVQWGTGGKVVTAVLGTADTLGIYQGDSSAADDDLIPVLLSRQTPA